MSTELNNDALTGLPPIIERLDALRTSDEAWEVDLDIFDSDTVEIEVTLSTPASTFLFCGETGIYNPNGPGLNREETKKNWEAGENTLHWHVAQEAAGLHNIYPELRAELLRLQEERDRAVMAVRDLRDEHRSDEPSGKQMERIIDEVSDLIANVGARMARVSDEEFDLRDARALLAWIEQQCRREYHSPDDLQRTILAELEGHDEQS